MKVIPDCQVHLFFLKNLHTVYNTLHPKKFNTLKETERWKIWNKHTQIFLLHLIFIKQYL